MWNIYHTSYTFTSYTNTNTTQAGLRRRDKGARQVQGFHTSRALRSHTGTPPGHSGPTQAHLQGTRAALCMMYHSIMAWKVAWNTVYEISL